MRVATVIGELLIVAGVAVFGYIVWQPWHTGVTVQRQQVELSTELSSSWLKSEPESIFDGEVPVTNDITDGDSYAILHAPAFGTTFSNVIAEGTTDWLVLNPDDKGIGHYSSTQQFGEVGNAALAAHRSGPFITPFREIMNLKIGDPLFVETPEGWYVYRFRSMEYVLPSEADVLNPFPRLEGSPGEDQILTLTTCHPKEWSIDERAISYAVFEEFLPTKEGPPAELIELNPELAKKSEES